MLRLRAVWVFFACTGMAGGVGAVTALLLYGFVDSEAQMVLEGLKSLDSSVKSYHCEWDSDVSDGGVDSGWSGDAVALIWCLGSTNAHVASVSNRVAAGGVPVVALMEDAIPPRGFDFQSGFLEICFNARSVSEVAARIEAVKARASVRARDVIEHGDLTIDVGRFAVRFGDRDIELTYKEYELLKLLASHPGRVFRREEILNRIWGDDYYGGTRTVDVHIRRVRSKLDDLSHSVIETMWRVGYRFTPPTKRQKED